MLPRKFSLGKVSVTVDSDWDNSKDYDKLTIVLDRSVYKTYISRKPVPAGTVLTDLNYWMPFSSLTEEIALDYATFVSTWTGNYNALLELFNTTKAEFESVINSIAEGNMAVSQSFGSVETIGISQKVLTELINKVMNNVDKFSNNTTFGVKITTNFDLFNIGTSNVATITCESLDGGAVTMKLYANGELIHEEEFCSSMTYNYTVSETTEFVVVTEKINGLTHTNKKTITAVPPVYVGAGSSYSSVITDSCVVTPRKSPSGYYDISVEDDQYIFFVVPSNMEIDKFKLMDFQMPFENIGTYTNATGVTYTIWKSEDSYEEDDYTIQVIGNDDIYKTIDVNIIPLLPDGNTIEVINNSKIGIKNKAISKNKLSDVLNNSIQFIESGTTANRPTTAPIGFMYFDTTLNLPIWKATSTTWCDATGDSV